MIREYLRAWKETVLILAYFGLLAIFVPIAQRRHLGTQGMFFAMVGAGVILAVIYFGAKLIKWRMEQNQLTGREIRSWMSGSVFAEQTLAQTDIGGTALIAINPETLLPYTSKQTTRVGYYDEETLAMVEEEEEEYEDEEDLFQPDTQAVTQGIARLTIEQIVRHIKPNSYRIFIGRSLTQPGNPAVSIGIYKKHMKIIGASQKGKSSMAAALLKIITSTHDPEHVLVALLDREDRTSKLFADLPHIAEVIVDDKPVLLHARTDEEVLDHLGYIVEIIKYRYGLSEAERVLQPLLIAYLEEFIALKDYFKTRIDMVAKEEKEQARRDYATLVFNIKQIARLGLKARVQLLMVAQVDYRDDDLYEALVNVTSGISFSVRATAAQAAGFLQTELLSRNAKENRVGQAVVEMPDCTDLVLAPEYNLEQKVLELEREVTTRGRKVSMTAVIQSNRSMVDQPVRKQEEQQEPTLLARAIQAYDEGYTSIDKLAAALRITPWQARQIMPQVKQEIGVE